MTRRRRECAIAVRARTSLEKHGSTIQVSNSFSPERLLVLGRMSNRSSFRQP